MVKHFGSNRMEAVFRALTMGVDTPVALGAFLRLKYGEHLQLAEMKVHPSSYTNDQQFKDDYLVTSYLSKYKELDTGVDCKAAAISAFRTAETVCKQTNHRFRQGFEGFPPSVHGILHAAARKINFVLGDVPDVEDLWCRWGPGVTTTLKGARSTLGEKLAEFPLCVSPSAAPYLRKVLAADLHLASSVLKADVAGEFSLLDSAFAYQLSCEVTTVPKKATTDRTIAIEPSWNIFLQLGVGDHIRRMLRRVGINLDDQTRNQRLAKLGSLTNSLATVDLRAASDTVSYALILDLLPLPWFVLLDDLRSKSYKLDGRVAEFNKFSTMGNGFTFELESLVFWALAQSVVEASDSTFRVAVYGDDIIVPVSCEPLFEEVFQAVGFEVNTSKTFWSGDFRESCGKHYYRGRDVTPIYQKESLEGLHDVYRCANRIRRYARLLSDHGLLDRRFRSAWLAAINSIDINRAHFVPQDCEEDGGLATSTEEHRHAMRVISGSGGYTLPVLRFIPTSVPYQCQPTDYGAGLAVFLRRRARHSRPPDLDLAFRQELLAASKGDLASFVSEIVGDSIPVDLGTIRRRGKYVSRRTFFTGTSMAIWVD